MPSLLPARPLDGLHPPVPPLTSRRALPPGLGQSIHPHYEFSPACLPTNLSLSPVDYLFFLYCHCFPLKWIVSIFKNRLHFPQFPISLLPPLHCSMLPSASSAGSQPIDPLKDSLVLIMINQPWARFNRHFHFSS